MKRTVLILLTALIVIGCSASSAMSPKAVEWQSDSGQYWLSVRGKLSIYQDQFERGEITISDYMRYVDTIVAISEMRERNLIMARRAGLLK